MKIEIPYSKKITIREEQISKVLRFNKIPVEKNKTLKFDETVLFSSHVSRYRSVFKSLLKGDVKIDQEKNNLIWNLRVDTIVFKATVFFLFMGFLAFVPFENELWVAILIGLIFATILFTIVWLNLKARITRITNQIIKHASNREKK